MKSFLVALCFCIGLAAFTANSPAFAASPGYALKVELSVDGKKVSAPRIITRKGETTTITQRNKNGEYTIEVVANEGVVNKHKGILMKFKISRTEKDGTSTVLATPQILTDKENEKATVTTGNAKEKVGLSVVVQRKNL